MATTPTPTPTPASGAGKSKKWWMIHTAAGVVVAILIATGITQCSAKNEEREEKEAKQTELIDAGKKISRAATVIDSLLSENRNLAGVASNRAQIIAEQADSIVVLNDSIAVLNDSLTVVNGKLNDCRNSRKNQQARKPQPKKNQRVNPAPVMSTPVKPDTVVIVRQGNGTGGGSSVNVNLNNSQNNGTIVVGNGNNVVVNNTAADAQQGACKVTNVQMTAVFYSKSR